MNKVAFHTLGCKVNQYETEAISEQFIQQGYKVVSFAEKADIYVINTCTVTNIADKKSRKMLSKAKKMNDEAVVVAVGCYVQVAHEALNDIPYIDVLIGNTHKNDVVSITEKFIETRVRENLIEDVHRNINYEELEIHTQLERTRATIKIQDGCDQYCSYCIIPYTRGIVRSRKPASVIQEVTELVVKGFHEVIITGIHLGSYGKDLDGDTELIDLIESLNRIEGLKRIRLGSLEPNLMTDDFINRLSQCDSVCPHFHLSMQSGCDSVLHRMKRKYTTKEYYKTICRLKEVYDNPSLTTDVIVGFPMESDEEHVTTREFIRQVQFSDLHVFKYSIRAGTSAARMKPQVDGLVKNQRSKELVSLGEEMKRRYVKSFESRIDSVLFEDVVNVDAESYLVGHTSRYVKVYVAVNDCNVARDDLNLEKKVMLSELFEDGILGVIE